MTAGNGETADAGAETPLAVFLINLDRSADRRAAMTEQLRRLGVPFRRVAAVDGQDLSEEELRKISDPEQIKKNTGRQMTRGEIACCLSHLKTYRIMAEEGVPAAAVLEDDSTLNEDFAAALKGWRRMPEHCRILQLITGDPITRGHKRSFSAIGNVRFPAGYVAARQYGAVAGGSYIIRRSYAAELLRTAFPVQAPIDSLLFSWRLNRYIPWILHRERKGGNGAIQSLGVHLTEGSLLQRERSSSAREAQKPPDYGIRAKINNWSIHWTVLFCKSFLRYLPLPPNRGRKLSFPDIASESPHLCSLRVALSCLALPGRNREAKLSAREKGD